MFWSKLKMTAPVVLASALLCGTGLMGYRAMGLPQAPAAAGKQQPRAGVDPEGKPTVPASSGSESPELDAIGKARIEVATKLRDAAHRLWQGGRDQRRRVSDRAETLRRSRGRCDGEDRRRPRPIPRASGHHAQADRRWHARTFPHGSVTQRDLLTAELARLDAEYALAKAKAKARSNAQ